MKRLLLLHTALARPTSALGPLVRSDNLQVLRTGVYSPGPLEQGRRASSFDCIKESRNFDRSAALGCIEPAEKAPPRDER